jgi:TonB family protein
LPSLQSQKSTDEDFKKNAGLSLAVHVVILLLFSIKMIFFSKPQIDLSQTISLSVGDFKSPRSQTKMPEKAVEPTPVAPEPQPEAAEPEKKPETKEVTKPIIPPKAKDTVKPKTDEINLTKSKAKQKEAVLKLKKLSALEKIKQDVKNEAVEKTKTVGKPKKSQVLPAGSPLIGLDKIEANSYLQSLDAGIKQQWSLPQWLKNKPFKTKVLVKINTQGQILSTQVIAPSGNPSYDQYCISAITKAAPFPQVPDKLSEKFSVDGFVVGFPE